MDISLDNIQSNVISQEYLTLGKRLLNQLIRKEISYNDFLKETTYLALKCGFDEIRPRPLPHKPEILTNYESLELVERNRTKEKIMKQEDVKVQPIALRSFETESRSGEKKNIDLIRDVPLQVVVELGRTEKQIKEILQFAVGTIVELDKLAGEPVDIMVNGKFIAKGEVVVIDESFGVRITDIIHPSKRISSI